MPISLTGTYEQQNTADRNSVVNLKGRRVLLVEDNKLNRKIAHALIDEIKAEIVEAENGRDAVDEFKKHAAGYFDVILMDVQMPLMNGYEATSAIRSVERIDAKTISIYAMTANTLDEDVRQVKETGMNGH